MTRTNLPSIKDIESHTCPDCAMDDEILFTKSNLRALGLLLAKHYDGLIKHCSNVQAHKVSWCANCFENLGARNAILQAFGLAQQEFMEWLKKEDLK